MGTRYIVDKREFVNGVERVHLTDTRKTAYIKKCAEQHAELLNEVEREDLRNLLSRLGHFDLADRVAEGK